MSHSRFRRGSTVVSIALATTALAVGLAAPAQALAKWSAPKNLFSTEVSRIGADSERNRPALEVRADAAGNAIAAWMQDVTGGCEAKWALRPVGGSWSAPKSLAPATGCINYGVALAVNKTGAAVVAWIQGVDVYAAVRPAGGVFGAGHKMNSGSGFSGDPAVTINNSGTVAVAWVVHATNFGDPNVVQARVRPSGGSFGGVEPLTTAGSAFAPSIAIDPSGNVLAAWVRDFPVFSPTTLAIETAWRPAGGAFPTTPTQTLDSFAFSSGSALEYAPDLALDATGRATAVWVQDAGGHHVVRSAAKIAGASKFGTVQTVNSGDTGNARMPRLAVDKSTDTAVAVWLQCTSTCTVRSAARPNGGAFGSLQTLSGSLLTTVYTPVVAVTSTGAAIAAWSGAPGGTGSDRVAVARRPKGGSFGSATYISGPQGTADETGPAIGVDGRGNAVVVWVHATGTPSALVRYADFLASWYRPDGLIKKAAASSYLGAHVYNTTGTHQLVSAHVARGHSLTFDIKVVNRSSAIDRIGVKGAGAKPGFTIKYLAGTSGTTAITTSVVNGSYVVKLAPGAGKTFRLVVTAKTGAAVGTANYWPVTATSKHDTTRKDVVKASVTITS